MNIRSKKKLSLHKNNSKFLKNRCFFLDRDGVINKEVGYIKDYRDFIFLKGVHKAIKFLNNKNFLVIIITNQAAVGKGIITKKKLESIHKSIKKNLYSENKAVIDDIFYSPYFKHSKKKTYRLNKFDRKPNPGMILKAAKKCKLKFYFKRNISLYNQIKNILKWTN